MKIDLILKYLERIGIALSILLNVIVGGPSNQTFSARNYKWKMDGRLNLVWFIDALMFMDRDHCFHSWIYYKTTRDLRKSLKRNKNLDNINKAVYYDDHYME